MPTPTIDIAGPVAGIDTHTVAIATETGKHLATDTFPPPAPDTAKSPTSSPLTESQSSG